MRLGWPIFIAGIAMSAAIGASLAADGEKDASPIAVASATTEPPVPGGGGGVATAPGASLGDPNRDGVGCISDESAIEELHRRREQLEAKQKELDAREAELRARERAVDEEIAKISNVRDEIEKVDQGRKKENDEKVSKLVETIEAMSPKAGSALLASVDEPLAIAAMARLSTEKLAKIMNLMDPRKSARLSELLTGMVRGKSRGGTAPASEDSGRSKAKSAGPTSSAPAATDSTVEGELRSPTRVKEASTEAAPAAAATTGSGAEKKPGLLASSVDIPLSAPKPAEKSPEQSKEKGGETHDDGKSEQ